MALLQMGSRGEAVSELQEWLSYIGYELAVDGVFGQGTKAAVMDFQHNYGLAVDGIVGPQTEQVLIDVVNSIEED